MHGRDTKLGSRRYRDDDVWKEYKDGEYGRKTGQFIAITVSASHLWLANHKHLGLYKLLFFLNRVNGCKFLLHFTFGQPGLAIGL